MLQIQGMLETRWRLAVAYARNFLFHFWSAKWVHKPSLGRVNYPSSAVSEDAADQLEFCGSFKAVFLSSRCGKPMVDLQNCWRSMQQAPSEIRHGAAVADLDGPRNASQVPTASHWEAVKDHIYRLYVIENRPLRNVRTILSQDFGFRATYAENTLTFPTVSLRSEQGAHVQGAIAALGIH